MTGIFPPMLPWNAMHVQIVHFPIALLMVAPVFVVIDLLMKSRTRNFGYAALILLILGTAGAFLAVTTGEAALDVAQVTTENAEAVEHHEELAETARTVYLILTAFYATTLFAPALLRRKWVMPSGVFLAMRLVALVGLLATSVLLANAAHAGGVLVHKYGLHAPIQEQPHEHEHEDSH